MNAIIGMTELALRENISNTAHQHIITIRQSSMNLLSIINDILDFSKIESGKLEIVDADYLFSSLINDVINIIRMRLVDSQVKFAVNIDSNIPNILIGDEVRIRQALLNILTNAVKYTEKGYVSLNVSGKITDEKNITLTMEVADSGKGMKDDDVAKLFGDFVQVDVASNKGIEGTGLGLAITNSIVKAAGGEILVSTKYGKGSTFTIVLPQKIGSDEKLADVLNKEEKSVLIWEPREIYADSIARTMDNLGVEYALVSTETEFCEKMSEKTYAFVFIAAALYANVKEVFQKFESKTKLVLLVEFGETFAEKGANNIVMPLYSISAANILNGVREDFSYAEHIEFTGFSAPDAAVLVVDDINTNLNVAEGLLMPYKMQVTLCSNGLEAISAAKAQKYDIIFMDHMMPEMDGVETVRRIRGSDSKNPCYNMPIIALTANAVTGAKEMFLRNGFDDFLSKPIDIIKLNAILEKWIPKEKQKKSLYQEKPVSVFTADNIGESLKIEGLDTQKGVAMSGGTIENYKRTLAIFSRDAFVKIEEIKKCLEANNLHLYTTYVHALKSAAANIGAFGVSETAKNLEIAGKQENLAFIKTHNAKLFIELESLMNNINDKLHKDKQETIGKVTDVEQLKTELVKLAEAVETVNPRAIKAAVKKIEPFINASDVGNVAENILQHILIGEYDEALSTINEFLKSE
jgi:CheY-like chemotaxis protein